MPKIYLDTCCLVRRAELSGPSPTARSVHSGSPVKLALAASSGEIATSEIGLIEFHDVVTSMWRDTNAPNSDYDESWCDAAQDETMQDIEEGRLLVIPQATKAFEKAMMLVTMATRQHGRKLRVWDATHLINAVGWSMALGEPVDLWTTDGDFEGFMNLYPYFASRISLRNLDH